MGKWFQLTCHLTCPKENQIVRNVNVLLMRHLCILCRSSQICTSLSLNTVYDAILENDRRFSQRESVGPKILLSVNLSWKRHDQLCMWYLVHLIIIAEKTLRLHIHDTIVGDRKWNHGSFRQSHDTNSIATTTEEIARQL